MSATLTAPPVIDAAVPVMEVSQKRRRLNRKTVSPRHPIPASAHRETSFVETGLVETGFVKPETADHTLVDLCTTETWRAGLPTFSWEEGYRLVKDPLTGKMSEVQLTLFDMLYECEDDIGAVFMSQSVDHSSLAMVLALMLQTYLEGKGWNFFYDVYVRWFRARGIQPKAPDITGVLGGRMTGRNKSYVVGRDGPMPSFVAEITSESTRSSDLITKKDFYASIGVKEYLIIDQWPETGEKWKLLGYRLKDEPHYTELTADADGEIKFETLGLRFVAIDQSHVNVFDLATGERLLTQQEIKARAEAEAEARIKAEQQLAQERLEKEQERQKNEQLRTRLIALGVDPDSL